MGSMCSKRNDIMTNDYLVGQRNEFIDKDDFFKEVHVNDDFSVIVTKRVGGKGSRYFAVGSKCPHYGANLAKGVMKDGRIYCPWHGACFDVETGDIEEFPGIDNIPKYPCFQKGDKIYVRVEPENMETKVMRPLSKCGNAALTFAIIGSGPAGYMCAQTLRQEGFDGRVIILTADKYLPYDRPKLTKAPGCQWEDIKLRGPNFYTDNDIEVLLETVVTKLDSHDHKIHVRGQEKCIVYDSVFIATGNKPKTYGGETEGKDLKNIFCIHNLEQSQQIANSSIGKRVVIVGSSFIAMELASSLQEKSTSIDIISRSDVPYALVLGELSGARFLHHLLTKCTNVHFHPGDEVKTFKGNGKGEVSAVITKRKKEIVCDVVIVAIGAVPVLDFLNDPLLLFHKKNKTLLVNENMRTKAPYTFAGGDCCSFPIKVGSRDVATIGHWQVALTHGRVAALNMLGYEVSVSDIIPFFWTAVCGVSIRYCGYGEGYDEILLFGSIEDLEYCCLYRRDNRVVAAMGVGCDPLITQIAIELQTESTWEYEYPPCISERFPEPPILAEDNAGRWAEIRDTDLLRHKLAAEKFKITTYKKLAKLDEKEYKMRRQRCVINLNASGIPSFEKWKSDQESEQSNYNDDDRIFEALAQHKPDQIKLNLALDGSKKIPESQQQSKPNAEVVEDKYFKELEKIFSQMPNVPSPSKPKSYKLLETHFLESYLAKPKKHEKKRLNSRRHHVLSGNVWK